MVRGRSFPAFARGSKYHRAPLSPMRTRSTSRRTSTSTVWTYSSSLYLKSRMYSSLGMRGVSGLRGGAMCLSNPAMSCSAFTPSVPRRCPDRRSLSRTTWAIAYSRSSPDIARRRSKSLLRSCPPIGTRKGYDAPAPSKTAARSGRVRFHSCHLRRSNSLSSPTKFDREVYLLTFLHNAAGSGSGTTRNP